MNKTHVPACILVFFLWLGFGLVPVHANTRASIVEKDMLVRLHPDGSADVTERIVFGINGSVNNLVMEFIKPEKGGIVLEKIVSAGYRGDVVCRPLESGQWDPTVFAGTYSLFDEPDRILVKAYYTFGRYRSRFVVQYHLPQAAVRYQEVSSLQVKPVSSQWPTRVERIHIRVLLPEAVPPGDLEAVPPGDLDAVPPGDLDTVPPGDLDAVLRGVFVGKAEVIGGRMVEVDIPDTVSGEEPVVLIVFPSVVLPEAALSPENKSREGLLATETALRTEAVEPALRAREKAAEEDGRIAMSEIVYRQVRRTMAAFSLMASFGGVLALLWLHRRMRAPKALLPSPPQMELLLEKRALVGGMLMFATGLTLGVALAIWQAYLMLVPALLLILRGKTGG